MLFEVVEAQQVQVQVVVGLAAYFGNIPCVACQVEDFQLEVEVVMLRRDRRVVVVVDERPAA